MALVLKNAFVFMDNTFKKLDILIDNGIVVDISSFLDMPATVDCTGLYIFPGFADVHVHLREPGFSYKETVKTGSLACAAGGYTAVCTMPNLNPVPDNFDNLKIQLDIIKRDSLIKIVPFGSITIEEMGKKLSDFDSLAQYVAGFSDDGRGVQNESIMIDAMKKARSLNKVISAHCEVNDLLNGGYIHAGEYASENNHKGICSESEWRQIERDIKLAKETGCSYHVCHISSKESVDLIRRAKADGVDITCETAPHYLVMNDSMLSDEGRFKMNPPIRAESDRIALIEGICDGTIDMLATDHAPHSAEEKSKGLAGSLMGIVGIETAFSVVYTELVKKGIITLEKLIELMNINPKKRFGIGGSIFIGEPADITIFDLDKKYVIDSSKFKSKGRATPFEKKEVFGKCVMTLVNGDIVWSDMQ